MGSSLLLILLAFLLVLLNGFFVAAEFGLVKLRQTRIRAIAKVHGWRGRILLKVHRDLDAYLSACQLGITLASLGLGWIGEPAFAALLRPLLNSRSTRSRSRSLFSSFPTCTSSSANLRRSPSLSGSQNGSACGRRRRCMPSTG